MFFECTWICITHISSCTWRTKRKCYRIFFRKKRDVRPIWLSPVTWDGLLRYWASDEFKAKSEQAKKNRASEDGVGSSLYTGGSIPTLEHKRLLQQKTGGEVTVVQMFMHTHQKKDKSWIDNKSSQAYPVLALATGYTTLKVSTQS